MIYDSLDIIPAKLFFKIIQTGEIHLLSDEDLSEDKLIKIWEKLEDENELLNPNDEANKILEISRKIESLDATYNKILLSVHYLKEIKDEDLINLIRESKFKLETETFDSDLKTIEREAKNILVKIASFQKQLPEPNEDEKPIKFDEVVLSYGVIVGSGFIDTNSITMSQYYALINVGNNKIKAMEENGK